MSNVDHENSLKVPECLLLGAFPCSRVNRTSCARGRKQADACCPPAKCIPLTPNSPFFSFHFSSFLYNLALPSKGPFGASDVFLLRTAQTLTLNYSLQPLLIQSNPPVQLKDGQHVLVTKE